MKNQIAFAVLKSYYDRYIFFFQDIVMNHQSGENFVRRILTSLDCQIFDSGSVSTSIIVKAGKEVDHVYFIQKNKVDVVDARGIFILSTLLEGSWFGDFNVFLELKSKFTYKASDDGRQCNTQVMVMMCPAKTFRDICHEYPETENWMVNRSLMRRNHLFQTQKTLYQRHNIDQPLFERRDSGIAIVSGRQLSETDVGTRANHKVMTDPYDWLVREQLMSTENCELDEVYEMKDADESLQIYKNTIISTLRSAITVQMARKTIENATSAF